MLLAIDSGNTNVVFAVYEGETQRGKWRASSHPRYTADEYAVWLTQLMALEGLGPEAVTGAVIANVVPAALHPLTSLCRNYFGIVPLRVGEPGVALGIPVHVERAEHVGADRLVNAVAGYRRFGGPLIVVDFGTATTFDVIGADGAYEGGIIAPAVEHSIEALHRTAALLPRVPVERPERVVGKDTVGAMKSGVYWGYVGLVEGLVARIRAERDEPMRVVATGGLAPVYAAATEVIEAVDQDLTLDGLRLVYETNAGTGA